MLYFDLLKSPFIKPKFSIYFGKIGFGTPYFYPRKFVKRKSGVTESKPVKYLWLDIINLGWKTKWSYDDYHFEWNPCLSLVILKKQLFITMYPPVNEFICFYWECWLFYNRNTNKTYTKEERLKQLFKEYSSNPFNNDFRNSFSKILKPKYLNIIDEYTRSLH